MGGGKIIPCYTNPEILSITFRNKGTGWKSYSMKIIIKDKTQ